MAITGSDATVVTTGRDSLRQTSVDVAGIVGGAQSGPTTGGFLGFGATNSGSALAGVTPEMAANIASGIDQYRARIQAILDQLEAVDSTSAFRGAGITKALSDFVTGVKTVSGQYLQKLVNAENEIVASVAKAYATQDQQVSSQMASDTGTLAGDSSTNGPLPQDFASAGPYVTPGPSQ